MQTMADAALAGRYPESSQFVFVRHLLHPQQQGENGWWKIVDAHRSLTACFWIGANRPAFRSDKERSWVCAGYPWEVSLADPTLAWARFGRCSWPFAVNVFALLGQSARRKNDGISNRYLD